MIADLIFLKYIICAGIILGVWMFPVWLAQQNKKEKGDMGIIRVSSWLFGWTGVGWVYALYLAAK